MLIELFDLVCFIGAVCVGRVVQRRVVGSAEVGASLIKAGQRFRLREPLETTLLLHYSAPFTGDAEATLPAGTLLEVLSDPPPAATGVYCRPSPYPALEVSLVPSAQRGDPRYTGFSLVISLQYLRTECDPVT